MNNKNDSMTTERGNSVPPPMPVPPPTQHVGFPQVQPQPQLFPQMQPMQPQPYPGTYVTVMPVFSVPAPSMGMPLIPTFPGGIIMAPPQAQPIPMYYAPPVDIADSLSPYLPQQQCVSHSRERSCSTGSNSSLMLPVVHSNSCRSRSASCESLSLEPSWSADSFSSADAVDESGGYSDESPRGHKQQLIIEVRETLEELLGQYFQFKMDRNIMSVFANQDMPEIGEKDVLRGDNVGNIRAKSKPSLNALVDFLQQVLESPHAVHRVDVILQKKKTGHLKGLLVNIEFSTRHELLDVRDNIWKGQGFENSLKKFAPALFAQDCSWTGLPPKDLHFVKEASTGDLRVQNPLPEKLQKLGLASGCRVKSMSVIYKNGCGAKKAKTFEVPANQFHFVLSEGKFSVKGVTRPLNDRTTLTVSFEEDWKTNFWRTKRAATFPQFLYEQQ